MYSSIAVAPDKKKRLSNTGTLLLGESSSGLSYLPKVPNANEPMKATTTKNTFRASMFSPEVSFDFTRMVNPSDAVVFSDAVIVDAFQIYKGFSLFF